MRVDVGDDVSGVLLSVWTPGSPSLLPSSLVDTDGDDPVSLLWGFMSRNRTTCENLISFDLPESSKVNKEELGEGVVVVRVSRQERPPRE